MELLSLATFFIIVFFGYSYLKEKFDQKDKIPFDEHLNFN